MKRKTAKEILAESFYEVSKTKDIDKITVKDITVNCGYSSATFYRHFTDKYDLIAWAYAETVEGIVAQMDKDSYTWKDTLIDFANLILKEKEYLANLLLHTSGHDAFLRYMSEIHQDVFRKHFLLLDEESRQDDKINMYIRLYCLGAVSLTCEWILDGCKIPPEDLAEVYEKAIPQPLQSLLKQNRK